MNFLNWPNFSSEEGDKVREVLLSNKVNYWTGDEVKSFEKEFALYSNSKYAIALANGTLALELSLLAINLEAGDEVIVSPRSFIASASCVVNIGATPVFADVDLETGNITAESIRKKITNRTRAVICVHIAGYPCELDMIMSLCKEKNIYVIEDCAQAHGAKYKNKPIGSIGDIGCFSFCQDKIITTGGEGGMVITNNKELWQKMWSYKDHGKSFEIMKNLKNDKSNGFKWVHESLGSNYRLTEIQAAIGRIQLKKLDSWRQTRENNALRISEVCSKYPDFFRVPRLNDSIKHAWYKLHIFLSREALKKNITPEKFINELSKMNIPCFYGPCPEIYLEKGFKNFLNKTFPRLPNAKALGETSLMFLVHPTLTEDDISEICKGIDIAVKNLNHD